MRKIIALLSVLSLILSAACGEEPVGKIAVFVKNQTRVAGMDDLTDSVRDRLSAELAGAGLTVMDTAEVASAFTRYKITAAEERTGLVDGLFTGGSTVRMAQMLGADYVLTASIVSAGVANLTAGGKATKSYVLRMTVKVCEGGQGGSVYGESWTRRYPVTAENASGTDASFYYDELLDIWASETGAKLAESSKKWKPSRQDRIADVSVEVSTTIDEMIRGLESGVRAPNELLDEMRRVIGGATVEIDGATVGSAPGSFRVSPGLHQMRVRRAWMKDWHQTVNIQDGSSFRVALELSDEGLRKFGAMEKLKAEIAREYAEAIAIKGFKVNFDTAAWRDVSVGNKGGDIHLEKTEVRQQGLINGVAP